MKYFSILMSTITLSGCAQFDEVKPPSGEIRFGSWINSLSVKS